MKKISRRWIPAVLSPALVASSIFLISGQATAVTDLPDKSAAEMLAMINTDENIAFSGRVIKKADLGLPPMNLIPDISQSMVDAMAKNLPEEMADFIPQASVEGEIALALEFLAGTHRANIFVDGPDRARLQVLDLLSERNFIRNGKDLWFYDAAKQEVVHTEVDVDREAELKSEAEQWILVNQSEFPFEVTSPLSVAQYFLAQADSTTKFDVDEDANIAGRDAYQLIMTPKSSDSLVDRVSFGIDAATGLPLSVRVMAVGQEDPAFEIAFETISYETPSASLFAFTPPVGASVEKVDLKDLEEKLAQVDGPKVAGQKGLDKGAIQSEIERLQSEGWSAVVRIPAKDVPAEFLVALRENRLYSELTKKVDGGRLFSTALFNVLFLDDGSILAGAVTAQTLLESAAK